MKLNFPTTVFDKESFRIYYQNSLCKFFIFQYTFEDNTEGGTNNNMVLQCFPAGENLVLLDDGITIKSSFTTYLEVKGRKLFTIGNITALKSDFARFYTTEHIPVLTAKPIKELYEINDGRDIITSIQIEISSDDALIAVLTLTLNPSPPAKRTSAS